MYLTPNQTKGDWRHLDCEFAGAAAVQLARQARRRDSLVDISPIVAVARLWQVCVCLFVLNLNLKRFVVVVVVVVVVVWT